MTSTTAATMTRRAIAVTVGIGVMVTLGACSFSVDEMASASKVAALAEDALEEEYGRRPEIVCPEPIVLKADETMRCDLTDPVTGSEFGMTVIVKDDDGALSFVVDDEPMG